MSGASEPPLLAVVRPETRPAAPFATRLLPNPQKAHAPPTRRGAVGKALRGLTVVGARGFEPPTFRSRNGRRSVAARVNCSQISESIANRGGREVQPSQLSTGVSKDFTTRLLPKIGTAFAPGTAPKVATTPTTADLVALHGGRDHLLNVADVAERLGVCAATVYRLCERGELPHIRIVNSIRVRRADLDGFVAGSATAAPKTGRRRPSAE